MNREYDQDPGVDYFRWGPFRRHNEPRIGSGEICGIAFSTTPQEMVDYLNRLQKAQDATQATHEPGVSTPADSDTTETSSSR